MLPVLLFNIAKHLDSGECVMSRMNIRGSEYPIKKIFSDDFEEKKSKYFCTEGGISSFRLTSQVLRHKEWTPEIIEQRQMELIGHLKKLWRL
jgi:hypothetical protein